MNTFSSVLLVSNLVSTVLMNLKDKFHSSTFTPAVLAMKLFVSAISKASCAAWSTLHEYSQPTF